MDAAYYINIYIYIYIYRYIYIWIFLRSQIFAGQIKEIHMGNIYGGHTSFCSQWPHTLPIILFNWILLVKILKYKKKSGKHCSVQSNASFNRDNKRSKVSPLCSYGVSYPSTAEQEDYVQQIQFKEVASS